MAEPLTPEQRLRRAVFTLSDHYWDDSDQALRMTSAINEISAVADSLDAARAAAPLDVERLARAEHASYERDNDATRIEWDDLTPNEKAAWRRHASVRAAEYARLGDSDAG